MLTLFGNLESGNVHKVQLILHRIHTPYRRVDVAQTRGEPRSAQYLKINPMGKVPAVLLEDGDVLTESGAILRFFAGRTGLWPADARSQAEVLRWMFFEQYSHEPSLAVMRYLRRYTDNPEAHMDAVRQLEPKARHALDVIQRRLSTRNWLAGDACTIADFALYPYTRLADEAGLGLGAFPAVTEWLLRFEDQPGFIPMYQDGAAETLSFEDYFQTAPVDSDQR